MKPTRKDIVRILRKRAIEWTVAELDAVRAAIRKTHSENEENAVRLEIEATAIAKFKTKAVFRDLMQKLTKAGIKFSIKAYTVRVAVTGSNHYQCNVNIDLGNQLSKSIDMFSTARQQKRLETAKTKLRELENQQRLLNNKLNDLEESRNEAIEDILSELLVSNDNTVTALLETLEKKIDAIASNTPAAG